MKRIFTRAVVFFWLLGSMTWLAADEKKGAAAPEVKPVEGTLTVGDHTYKLAHVVAYETKRDDDTFISVLASDRRIPFDQIQAALREDEGSDDHLSLDQPHVVITFKKSGEALWCKAAADGGSFTRGGEALSGKFKFENGRARGQLKLPPLKDAFMQSAFDFRFDVALGAAGTPQPAAKPAGPVKPSVTGTFKGNGKPAKLAFVSARTGEPFADKPSILLVFTEKDHSKDPKPDFKAGFGEYGSALVISCFEDGQIFSCQVAHAAHGKMPFSSVGNIRTSAFDVGTDRVEGEIQTEGEVKFFDKTWEVDLKFVAPYTPPATKPAAGGSQSVKKSGDKPGKAKPGKKPDPDEDDDAGDDGGDDAPAKGRQALKVKELPLPKDASDVVYKKLVEQMTFKSQAAVQALAGEFSKKLDGQGWKSDGADLVTPQSVILKRNRGEASLTIFVKPAGKGSQVTIMTEGLDWDSEK